MWPELERQLRFDPSQRGFAGGMKIGDLELSARHLQGAKRVAIATGFYIPVAQAIESDGPLGAVFLARALLRAGKEVVLLMPEAGKLACEVSCHALALACPAVFMPTGLMGETLVDELGCDTFVAIEYPGQGSDQACRNMRGIDITAYVPLLDEAFNYAKRRGVFTVAVGDGGNELGCGGPTRMMALSTGRGSIAAATEADVVLAAGVSNWGVYVLLAALSVLEGVNLVPTASEEHELLEKLCAVGVVDGCSGLCQATVDGIDAPLLAQVVQGLHDFAAEHLVVKHRVAATSLNLEE